MKLYHGSNQIIKVLQPQQATEDELVPKDEQLHAIYLTPNFDFALAMALRPEGVTTIDNKEKTIEFEKPELFRLDEDVFIYSINSENIAKENLKYVDERQYAVIGLDQLLPENCEVVKARKILEYYELSNWKENKEQKNEVKNSFKMK